MPLDFDGGNDYVVIRALVTTITNITAKSFSCDIYADTWGEGAGGRFIDQRDPGGSGYYFALDSANRALRFFQDFSSVDGEFRTAVDSINTGAWYRVGVSYSRANTANQPVFYINGSAQTTTIISQPSGAALSDGGRRLCFGADSSGTASFNGKIGECSLWTGLLTAYDFSLLGSALVKGAHLQIKPASLLFNFWFDELPGGMVTVAGSSLFVDRSQAEIEAFAGVGTANPTSVSEDFVSYQ